MIEIRPVAIDDEGIEQITTMNETGNEPIRRLNERLGYRVAPGRIRLKGPLSDAP